MECRKCRSPAESGKKHCAYHLEWCRNYMAAVRQYQVSKGRCHYPFCRERKLIYNLCEKHRKVARIRHRKGRKS